MGRPGWTYAKKSWARGRSQFTLLTHPTLPILRTCLSHLSLCCHIVWIIFSSSHNPNQLYKPNIPVPRLQSATPFLASWRMRCHSDSHHSHPLVYNMRDLSHAVKSNILELIGLQIWEAPELYISDTRFSHIQRCPGFSVDSDFTYPGCVVDKQAWALPSRVERTARQRGWMRHFLLIPCMHVSKLRLYQWREEQGNNSHYI